jgi:Cellulose binding domain/Fibronectin type III domain
MPFSRRRGAALRGLLIGCCAALATAAALGAGTVPAPGAVPIPGTVPAPGALPAPGAVSGTAGTGAAGTGAAGTGAAAADTTPPSEPGELSSGNVYLNTTVGLSWTPSTDDVAVTGYEVYAWSYSTPESVSFSLVPAQVTPSATKVTAVAYGLTPDRHYLFYVVAVDAAGNRSVPSLLTWARAMREPPSPYPTPRPAPPARPYDLRVSAGPALGHVSLTWAYVDPTPTTVFMVFRRSSSGWSYAGYSSLPRTLASIGGEASYTFQVVSRDDVGSLSTPTNAATYLNPSASPSPTPAPATCAVTYDARTWASGFTADLTIENTGGTPIDGWRLAFGFPTTAQRLTTGWSATWTQSGTDVSATSLAWNETIKPGRSIRIGFAGTHSGGNPSPTAFTLNGKVCAAG